MQTVYPAPTPSTVRRLAAAFSTKVREAFDAATVADINKINDMPDNWESCATHDECDANMLMLAAYAEAFGHEPILLCSCEDQALLDQDAELWNAAWQCAKISGFTAQP